MPTLDPDSVSAYLTTFLDIIVKLERLGREDGSATELGAPAAVAAAAAGYEDATAGEGGGGRGGGALTEAEMKERELLEWASLKECQIKFIRENFDLGG